MFYLFKVGRLPDALERLLSFPVAFIAVRPDNAIPFIFPLAEQILDSLRYVQRLQVFNSLNIEIQKVGKLSLSKSNCEHYSCG